MIYNDPLELKHPDTREPIDFQAMSYQELLDLEFLCSSHKTVADLKISGCENNGQDAPRPLLDFSKYCGITILKSQQYRALIKEQSNEIRLKALSAAVESVLDTDAYTRIQSQYMQNLKRYREDLKRWT